jgi:hypothetical protein
MARSRLPRGVSNAGASTKERPCSAVSQLPIRTPSCLTPLTRFSPAASSRLSNQESEASWANRRTAGVDLSLTGQGEAVQVQSVSRHHDPVQGEPGF